jgi:UDP-N-acetylmuramyl pentapeptide synthase
MKVMEFTCNDEAAAYLKQAVACGDLLLFKGSNSTRIGQIIQQLKEEFA